jgi:hypothetical protein
MRTLGFRTHVMLVVAGAIGVLAALGRPWYAAAPPPPTEDTELFEVHGPLHATLDAMRRWITEAGGLTGWDALGSSASLLAGAAGLAAVCAVGNVLPATQLLVREPLRYLGLVTLGVAAWRLVDSPGPNGELELRLGALGGFVCAAMLCICAQGVANAPNRRRIAPPTYTPPPPPVFEAR